jgi:hypothetical protein
MSTHNEAVEDIKKAKDVLDSVGSTPVKYPDAQKHLYISLVKSFLRLTACVTLFLAGTDPALLGAWLKVSAGFLGLAECLGIIEELV